MDYFRMKTDKRLCKLPQMQIPKELSPIGMTKEKLEKITKPSIVYVKGNHGLSIEYADYLEKPIPLIAEKFQRILQKYQQDMLFHRVTLIEKETGKQKPYYFMMPPKITCADQEESRYDAVGNVQDFVLNIKKAGNRKIFLAEDYDSQLLVRLDVAESILRREADGIWFEPVKTAERSR